MNHEVTKIQKYRNIMVQAKNNLDDLIRNMTPVLREGDFVFYSSKKTMEELYGLQPVLLFEEEEGTSCILKKDIADQNNLDYDFTSRMITLNVYSALEAVGFLAAITKELATANISVNAVSAFYHDHLFVPADKADLTMQTLNKMINS